VGSVALVGEQTRRAQIPWHGQVFSMQDPTSIAIIIIVIVLIREPQAAIFNIPAPSAGWSSSFIFFLQSAMRTTTTRGHGRDAFLLYCA